MIWLAHTHHISNTFLLFDVLCTLILVCVCVCVPNCICDIVYSVRFVCFQSVAMFVWFVVMKASPATHDEILSNPFFSLFFSICFVLLFGTHTHSSSNTGYPLLILSVLLHRPCLNQFGYFSFVYSFVCYNWFQFKSVFGFMHHNMCMCSSYTIQNTQFCLSNSMGLHCLTFTFTH